VVFSFGSTPVFAAEFVDTPGGVHDLLLTGIEWVTSGADLDVKILPKGRTGNKRVTAAAHDLDIAMLRMDSRFHGGPSHPASG